MRPTRRTNIRRSKRGDFQLNVGIKPDGTQPKFYCGDSEREFVKRRAAIKALWADVCEYPKAYHQTLKTPAWDAARLAAAKSIAKGEVPLVPAGDHEDQAHYYDRIERLRANGVTAQADDRYEVGAAMLQQEAKQVAERSRRVTGQTLHPALTAYRQYLDREHRDGNGRLRDGGKTMMDQVTMLKSYLPDVDLARLDYQQCDELFGVLRRRPLTKRYEKPMARKTCCNLIGTLGRFLKWLHTAADWRWRLPEDSFLIRKTPIELEEDIEKEAADIPTWTPSELRTIYEYATPLERLFFLLGINCAYGADQSGRLRVRDVKLDVPRPHIDRIRRKKKTRSVHLLWSQTEQGLRWALDRRPASAETDHVVLTANDLPYWRQTKGENRSQDIPNLWNKLLDRIQKDHPQFRRLPFNSLRDTSIDLIRKLAGEEIARLHSAHKHQSDDQNLRRYSNPVRRRHFKALAKLERKLRRVFESVELPFPPDQPKIQQQGGPNITPAQIRKIRELDDQGFKHAKIMEIVGVSRPTVWRHTRKPK